MNQSFQLSGYWRLPGVTERTVAGTLKFEPDTGGTLFLTGSFKDITRLDKLLDYEIVQGITTAGELVTLFNCIETSSKFAPNFPGMLVSTYYAQIIYLGIIFSAAADIRFKNSYVSFTNLDLWLDLTGFERTLAQNNRRTVAYNMPELINSEVDNEILISLLAKLDYSERKLTTGNLAREVNMDQNYYFKIDSNKERALDEFLVIIKRLGNFLTLLISVPIFLTYFEAYADLNRTKTSPGIQYDGGKIRIFFSPSINPYKTDIRYYDVLLPYGLIVDWYPALLKTWFADSKNLESIHDLYFGYIYNNRSYAYQAFLSLVQCLESVHRNIYPDEVELPQGDFDVRIREILSSVKADHKNWLEGKLKYSNEVTLRKRINRLIEDFPIIRRFFSNNRKMDSYVYKVVATRNYLTHYDEEDRVDSAKDDDLRDLNEKTKLVLDVLFLSRLGLSQTDIEIIFEQIEPYSSQLLR